MRLTLSPLLFAGAVVASLPVFAGTPVPYTAASYEAAKALMGEHVVLFKGSRHAWVYGKRVALGNEFQGEEVEGGFVRFLDRNTLPEPLPIPAGLELLERRWVYEFPAAKDASKAPVNVLSEAARRGLFVTQHASGLVGIGSKSLAFDGLPSGLIDGMVTLFDTPERFANPEIAARSIPTLVRQGSWKEHTQRTEASEWVQGDEKVPLPPVKVAAYDFSGFNAALLGSAVPEPGVYPRILFSEADLPMLRKRIEGMQAGQQSLIKVEEMLKGSWLAPETSDGQLFAKLVSGSISGLQFKGATTVFGDRLPPPGEIPLKDLTTVQHIFENQKPGIYSSHVAYVPECLAMLSLHALLKGDDELGRRCAAAVVTYCRLREPYLDAFLGLTDYDYGQEPFNGNAAETHWRFMHGLVAHMNLPFLLDFAGKWMRPEERQFMERFIAKATYGRRSYGQDGHERFTDVNWVTWDMTHFLALCAIEGLPGFDREAYASGAKTVRAFLDYGFTPSGQVFESNGKTGGGFTFHTLSMIALARRGENHWGHPHLRKHLEAQALCVSPSGRVVVSGGTFSGTFLSLPYIHQIKAFYPENRIADFLLSQPASRQHFTDHQLKSDTFDRQVFREELARGLSKKRIRMPSPMYPGLSESLVYDSDAVETTREEAGLPLEFIDPVHGVFSAYSDLSREAVWINLLVRPNHYLGTGHHHSDAGMIHFSASGVDWFTESPAVKSYDGKLHNQVLIDGESQPGMFPSRGVWLDGEAGQVPHASCDLGYAYSWRWLAQIEPTWGKHDADAPLGWEVEPARDVLQFYKGESRNKLRYWWATYNYSNWTPLLRAPFNPVQYVFRSVALVRGEKPYGLVIDDAKKDAVSRLYEWTACVAEGVEAAEVSGLPAGWLALKDPVQSESARLLVIPLAVGGKVPESLLESFEVPDVQGKPTRLKTVRLRLKDTSARFRVILYPWNENAPLPKAEGDTFEGDTLQFTIGKDQRSRAKILRSGKVLLDLR